MVLDYSVCVVRNQKMGETQGTCLLCFSVTNVMDIKCTHLSNVYEEISDFKVQADSHPVCHICYTKLLQCEQLLMQIQKVNGENQPQDPRPMVNLSMLKTDNWSLPDNFVEIEWYPEKTREDNNGKDVQRSPGHCAFDTEVNIEYIKVECSPGIYEDEDAVEPFDVQYPPEPPTAPDEGKTHACDLCSKRFPYLSYLKRHRVVHDEIKPYSCDVCSKTFTRISTLKTHKLLHSSDKPHTCEYCRKKFTQIRQYQTHLLIHTHRKPYVCDFCNVKFTQLCNLKAHKQTHAHEKPYGCEVCGKKFKQNCTLTRHKIIHSGVKQFRCDVCDKRFSYNRSLSRHMLRHTDDL